MSEQEMSLIEQLENPPRIEGGHLDGDRVVDLMRNAAFALSTMIGVASKASARSERGATNEQIKHMVDRFLGWKLPDNFNPDFGISYTRPNYPESAAGPSGTNLFDATQADAMVRYMIEEIPTHS